MRPHCSHRENEVHARSRRIACTVPRCNAFPSKLNIASAKPRHRGKRRAWSDAHLRGQATCRYRERAGAQTPCSPHYQQRRNWSRRRAASSGKRQRGANGHDGDARGREQRAAIFERATAVELTAPFEVTSQGRNSLGCVAGIWARSSKHRRRRPIVPTRRRSFMDNLRTVAVRRSNPAIPRRRDQRRSRCRRHSTALLHTAATYRRRNRGDKRCEYVETTEARTLLWTRPRETTPRPSSTDLKSPLAANRVGRYGSSQGRGGQAFGGHAADARSGRRPERPPPPPPRIWPTPRRPKASRRTWRRCSRRSKSGRHRDGADRSRVRAGDDSTSISGAERHRQRCS